MMKLATFALVAGSASLAAQVPAVRLINTPDASTKPTFGLVSGVRQLSGGKVLVNDIVKRQLTLFDQALGTATVVADSASGSANSYGIRPGGMIGYLGDSTLFVDPAGLSMFVLDPDGRIARVASVPRSQDATMLASLGSTPGVDAKGRLVYRTGFGRIMGGPPPGGAGGGSRTAFGIPEQPDSAALVRVDLASRKLDTAAFFKIPKMKMNMTQTERGMTITPEINPLPIVDDWTVLSNGTVAIVRGQDYHVDLINPDGSVTVAPKVPFEWQRLTDEDKAAVIDSAKAAAEKARANPAATGGPGSGGLPGGGQIVMSFSTGGDGARTSSVGGGGVTIPQMSYVSLNEMPDYRPAFSAGSVRADLDGNLWIRTSATRAGSIAGPIYDVLNSKGALVDRVQIPSGRTIVGFGKGGIVYMQARDDKGAWLERTHR